MVSAWSCLVLNTPSGSLPVPAPSALAIGASFTAAMLKVTVPVEVLRPSVIV
jgi:hypothetical protein